MTAINSPDRFIPIRTLTSSEEGAFFLQNSNPLDPYSKALCTTMFGYSDPRILNFTKRIIHTTQLKKAAPLESRKIDCVKFPIHVKILDAPDLSTNPFDHVLTSEENLLAIALAENIYSYDLTYGRIQKLLTCDFIPTCLKLCIDADSLVYGHTGNKIIAFNIERLKTQHTKAIPTTPIALVQDGPIFFAGCDKHGHIIRSDIREKPISLINESDDESVLSLAMQNMQLASGFSNHLVKIWDIRKTKVPLTVFKEFNDGVRAMCFHPNGKLFAGGGLNDKTIKILNPDTKYATLAAHTKSQVTGIQLNDEGTQAISCHGPGSQGNNCKLWKIESNTMTLCDETKNADTPVLFSSLAQAKTTLIVSGKETLNIWDNIFTKSKPIEISEPFESKFEIR